MRNPRRAIRSADPARPQLQRPDARGEADLRTLVGEAPAPARMPAAARSGLRPILVAVLVLVLVVTGSALVLARGGTTDRTAPAASTSGMPTIDGCDPVALRPFLCGSYISNEATKDLQSAITKDPLTMSFSRAGSGYLLSAKGTGCFTASLPVRLEAVKASGDFRLVPVGTELFGSSSCPKGWAYRFLRGELRISDGGASTGSISFSQGKDTLVDFAYVGSSRSLASRNDMRCITAHVSPFTCAKYRSVSGTGTLSFLASDRYTLSFEHDNGVLNAGFMGRCNALNQTFEVAGSQIVAFEGGQTLAGCGAPAGSEDNAVSEFFTGVLTYRIDGNRVTFWKGADSAVFEG